MKFVPEDAAGKVVNFSVLLATAMTSARVVTLLARKVTGGKKNDSKAGKASKIMALAIPAQVGAKPPMEFVHICRKHKQDHLLADWDSLSEHQRVELLRDIQTVDLEHLGSAYKTSTSLAQDRGVASEDCSVLNLRLVDGAVQVGTKDGAPEPVKSIKDITPLEKIRWVNLGYALIAQGKLGVVILAGGQGTRLGSSAPKGCYDIGLPSKKSLFQLQAERIRRLQQLSSVAYYNSSKVLNLMHVYIMTSPMTHEATREHYKENSFFGLDEEQVHFFQQGTMPCLTSQGKIIMETPSKIARSPNGNGGLYIALLASGCLSHMKRHGIQCVDVNCIDNALARVADPMFNGYCWELGVDCGARTLAKANPMERVGVFVQDGDGIGVREYSEMPVSELHEVDSASGLLKYNWSNICMHHFSLSFLTETAEDMALSSRFHVAHKKIPSKDGDIMGIKLEQFIFDPFPNAQRTALLEVLRNEEFAPVKNAPNEDKPDSPETARGAVLKLHASWVEEAGGQVKIQKGPSEGVEISPLVSYAGEGLEHLCRRRIFKTAHDIMLQGLAPIHVYKAAAAKAILCAGTGTDNPRNDDNPFKRISTMFNRTMSQV